MCKDQFGWLQYRKISVEKSHFWVKKSQENIQSCNSYYLCSVLNIAAIPSNSNRSLYIFIYCAWEKICILFQQKIKFCIIEP